MLLSTLSYLLPLYVLRITSCIFDNLDYIYFSVTAKLAANRISRELGLLVAICKSIGRMRYDVLLGCMYCMIAWLSGVLLYVVTKHILHNIVQFSLSQ